MERLLMILFGLGSLISGWRVITSKNPVTSVMFLVLAFVNISLLLIMLGLEFLPLLFIVVYVGAIAVLFLFVVMLLNIKLVEVSENGTRYAPIGGILGLVLLYEITSVIRLEDITSRLSLNLLQIVKEENVSSLGNLLYTEYFMYFVVSGLILLVSMIGAIVLCLYHEKGIKRQDLFGQTGVEYTKSVVSLDIIIKE